MKVVIRHFSESSSSSLPPSQTTNLIKGMKQRESDGFIVDDFETNQNESGNQALSSSSSLPPSQTTNPIQGDETEGI